MNRSADWIAWVLQFLLGLAAGAVVGAAVIWKISRFGYDACWMNPDHVPMFLSGAALVGGALASLHGDRLWLGQSYQFIAPDGVRHNRASRMASYAAGGTGLALAVVALLRQFGLWP